MVIWVSGVIIYVYIYIYIYIYMYIKVKFNITAQYKKANDVLTYQQRISV